VKYRNPGRWVIAANQKPLDGCELNINICPPLGLELVPFVKTAKPATRVSARAPEKIGDLMARDITLASCLVGDDLKWRPRTILKRKRTAVAGKPVPDSAGQEDNELGPMNSYWALSSSTDTKRIKSARTVPTSGR